MPRKPKFKPEITRVKLNPEQAVLGCSCYTGQLSGGENTFNNLPTVVLCRQTGGKSTTMGNCMGPTPVGFEPNSDLTTGSGPGTVS